MTDKTMTLEQVRDWHRDMENENKKTSWTNSLSEAHKAAADAITRHLSQPAERGEAVAWIDEFGNVFPLAAHSLTGRLSWQQAHKRNWRPLYTATPPAAGVPDGWKLVPIKMTEEMKRAGSGFNYIENAWNAVLAATPSSTIDVAAVRELVEWLLAQEGEQVDPDHVAECLIAAIGDAK